MNPTRSPSHAQNPGASCDERERNAALVAIAASLVMAFTIVVIAMLAIGQAGTVEESRLGLGSRNSGSGDGDGFGASVGDASSTQGDGPGSGSEGQGRGSRASRQSSPMPKGAVTGAVPDPEPAAGESLVAGEDDRLPAFGFTPPTVQEQELEVPNAVAAGAIDGFDGEGAAGKGGASGTASFGGIRTHAKSIVFILDFSSSVRHFDLEDALKREFARSIEGMSPSVLFGVVAYGLSPDGSSPSRNRRFLSDFPWATGRAARVWGFDPRDPGPAGQTLPREADVRVENRTVMPPERLVEASKGNKQAAISWVRSRNLSQPGLSGSSDIWDSVESALLMGPEAIFLLTDTSLEPSKVQDAAQVLEALNRDRRTRIHTITFNREKDHEDPTLRSLAREWGGLYRHVVVPP